jgi:hypothetical protein
METNKKRSAMKKVGLLAGSIILGSCVSMNANASSPVSKEKSDSKQNIERLGLMLEKNHWMNTNLGDYGQHTNYGQHANYGQYVNYSQHIDEGGYNQHSNYGQYTDYNQYGKYSQYAQEAVTR